MKLSFLKKILTFCALGISLVTLGACQSAGQDAKVDVSKSSVQILVDTQGRRIGRMGLYIDNNTIYNTKKIQIAYRAYTDVEGTTLKFEACTEPQDLVIAHGSYGYLYYETQLTEYPDVVRIDIVKSVEVSGEIKATKFTEYYNIWESYLGWWIVCIAIVAIAWISFACAIFGKDVTKEQAREELKGHVAAIAVCSILFLIIALFPLIWGSWFATVLLLGTIAVVILGQIALTGIKALVSK